MLQTALAHHELEGLDVHEKLSLVVIRSTRIDCPVTDFRLERIGVPQFDRIHRLDIIMAVNEYGRKRRIHCLLSEYYRMAGSRIDGSLVCASFFQELHQSLRTAQHVRLVLLKRADRRNPEK